MGLLLVTPPAIEPVTLTEAKLHIRQDETADDALITSLISAARQHVENVTGRSLITQTWRLYRDTFPDYGGAIRLGRSPVLSVVSLKYYNEAEVEQTLSALDYDVDPTSGEIALGYGSTWPTSLYRRNAVTIDFTAGYGATAASVPAPFRQAILLLVGDFYANREAHVVGATVNENPAVDRLLSPLTLPLVA
jgi:uncharacterized phiE125 gp8 family phage protein